jgi:hypothetical protein
MMLPSPCFAAVQPTTDVAAQAWRGSGALLFQRLDLQADLLGLCEQQRVLPDVTAAHGVHGRFQLLLMGLPEFPGRVSLEQGHEGLLRWTMGIDSANRSPAGARLTTKCNTSPVKVPSTSAIRDGARLREGGTSPLSEPGA